MRSHLLLLVVPFLVIGFFTSGLSYPSQPNAIDYCIIDNGTLAHTLSNAMLEFNESYSPSCLWRPFDPTFSQLYAGDLWVCITGGINKAVFDGGSSYGWIPFGLWSNNIMETGDPNWPPEIPVMSDHDTYVGTNDEGYIGLEAYRHSLMWNDPADADYIIFVYTIKNTGSNALNNLYISRFSDFDLIQPSSLSRENICGTDFATLTVWMKQRQNNCNGWVGIRRLNGNLSTANHWTDASDPTSESAIINLMVNGNWFAESGAANWRILATFGPFSLALGASLDFTFATAFGTSYADMMANLNRAKQRYDGAATIIEPTTLGRIKGIYH